MSPRKPLLEKSRAVSIHRPCRPPTTNPSRRETTRATRSRSGALRRAYLRPPKRVLPPWIPRPRRRLRPLRRLRSPPQRSPRLPLPRRSRATTSKVRTRSQRSRARRQQRRRSPLQSRKSRIVLSRSLSTRTGSNESDRNVCDGQRGTIAAKCRPLRGPSRRKEKYRSGWRNVHPPTRSMLERGTPSASSFAAAILARSTWGLFP